MNRISILKTPRNLKTFKESEKNPNKQPFYVTRLKKDFNKSK